MINMSHCRFENTYMALRECYEALVEAGDIESLIAESNEYEKRYIKALINMCKDIINDFDDEI